MASPGRGGRVALATLNGRAAELGARSRDHLGILYEWIPDGPLDGLRWALDVERLQGRTSPLAAEGEPEEAFLLRWTRAEVTAKLTGTPILLVWKRLAAGLAGAAGPQVVELDGVRVQTRAWRDGDQVLSTGAVGRTAAGARQRARTSDRNSS